jgi:hypothetical protein
MKKMTAIALVLGLGGLVACGGGDSAKAKKLKDDMCECKDQKCVDDLEKQADEFSKSLKDKYKSKDDVPKDLMESYEGFKKCEMDVEMKISAGGGSASGSGSATP